MQANNKWLKENAPLPFIWHPSLQFWSSFAPFSTCQENINRGLVHFFNIKKQLEEENMCPDRSIWLLSKRLMDCQMNSQSRYMWIRYAAWDHNLSVINLISPVWFMESSWRERKFWSKNKMMCLVAQRKLII